MSMEGGITSVFGAKGDPSSPSKGGPCGKGPMKGLGMPMPGKGAPGPAKQKSVICQYWKENRCNRGEMCSYAHGEHELRTPPPPIGMKGPPIGKGFSGKGPGPGPGGVMPPPPVPTNRKTQLCVYYKDGRCTRGNTCNYAHGEHELLDKGANERVSEWRTMGGRPPPERPPPPVRPVNNRFDVRSGPQVRAPREMRPDRSRSPRRLKKVAFARSELMVAIERQDCSVRGPPEEMADVETVNGSAQKVGEDTDAEAKVSENGDAPKEGIGATEVDEAENAETENAGQVEEKETAPKAATPAPPPAPDPPPDPPDHPSADPAAAATAASYLLSEDGASELNELYGIGAQLLRGMGWHPGVGVGANLNGELEPVSIKMLALSSTHFGRKDRRCLGRRKPKRFRDSDESSPSRTPSSSTSRSTSKSSQKSSKSSSASSKKKKKRRRRKRKKSRSSSSRRSSASSSSSSSKSQRKKKGKFTEAPTGPAPGAGAADVAGQPQQAVVEDPETAQAKKRVLAKLTELQKVEPKEQRAKEFRNLLRDWHPDKNPEKKDMATAVFQFLQKGKSLLNLK